MSYTYLYMTISHHIRATRFHMLCELPEAIAVIYSPIKHLLKCRLKTLKERPCNPCSVTIFSLYDITSNPPFSNTEQLYIHTTIKSSRPSRVNSCCRCTRKFRSSAECTITLMKFIHATWNSGVAESAMK